MAFKIKKLLANEKYSTGSKRSFDSIKGIVIHYTGGTSDTAYGNAKYFSPTGGNTRTAGAHFFVDRSGEVYKSVNINRTAWSVGGVYTTSGDAGTYYKKLTNANTVSIELCAIASKFPSKKQIKATRKLIKYIQDKCPNATIICRHYDVNGKACPATMCGSTSKDKKWAKFLKKIS